MTKSNKGSRDVTFGPERCVTEFEDVCAEGVEKGNHDHYGDEPSLTTDFMFCTGTRGNHP